MNRFIRDWTPPALLRLTRNAYYTLRRNKGDQELRGLKDKGWYDRVYESSEEYKLHYTESYYYYIWTVISDRIIRSGAMHVLDLGCGPGQFAMLLSDKGLQNYTGIDFSEKAVAIAGERCPQFRFISGDLNKEGSFESINYDTLVTMEFLEHVEFDLEVIRRVRTGVNFIATVPNYPYISHVRHFESKEEVIRRYSPFFDSFTVDDFRQDDKGTVMFVMQGIRAGGSEA